MFARKCAPHFGTVDAGTWIVGLSSYLCQPASPNWPLHSLPANQPTNDLPAQLPRVVPAAVQLVSPPPYTPVSILNHGDHISITWVPNPVPSTAVPTSNARSLPFPLYYVAILREQSRLRHSRNLVPKLVETIYVKANLCFSWLCCSLPTARIAATVAAGAAEVMALLRHPAEKRGQRALLPPTSHHRCMPTSTPYTRTWVLPQNTSFVLTPNPPIGSRARC